MTWLLDTNVISELRKPKPNPQVVAFVKSCPLPELYISAVTLAEIRYGIETNPEQGRRNELAQWLATFVRPMFEGRVLEIDEDILLRWRVLVETGRKVGRTFAQPDLFIAAIAVEQDLTVVTRNTVDYEGTGVRLLNPWHFNLASQEK